VVIKIIEGARTKIVSTTNRFRLVTSCCGVSGALKLRFTVGIASAPRSKFTLKSVNNKKYLITYPSSTLAAESKTLFCASFFVLLSNEKK